MSAFPLVTIGMPVRNGGKYFERALESVLSQDYPNIEIIISDNASDDETGVISKAAASLDKRIRYIRHEEVLRAQQNFWFCVDEARGDYFMWAAHDDLRSSNFVCTLLNEAVAEDIILIFPDLFITSEFGSDGSRIEYDFDNTNLSLISRLRKQALMQCFHIYGLWRTDILKKLPRPDLSWWPDLPILMSAAARGKFVYAPGARFIYLEVPKTDAERAAYQDGLRDLGKARNVLKLVGTTFFALRPLVGSFHAFLGSLFVVEKNCRFAVISIKRRLARLSGADRRR